MKLVKFCKYVRPDEAEKWWNRVDARIMYVNPEEVSHVTKTESQFYSADGYKSRKLVTVLNMKNGEKFEVEGSEEEVVDRLLGAKPEEKSEFEKFCSKNICATCILGDKKPDCERYFTSNLHQKIRDLECDLEQERVISDGFESVIKHAEDVFQKIYEKTGNEDIKKMIDDFKKEHEG